MKNMITPEDVAFKVANGGDILIFINGKHEGVIVRDPVHNSRWGEAKLYDVVGVDPKTSIVYLADKDQMRRKVSALYNESVEFYAPFKRLQSISRVTKNEVNSCVVKIVENSDKLSKDQMVKLLKEIIL